ncbi:hypothetical protein C2S51_016900 [Perilla frutescens var. frutescens]|nr:hypothetical protein C2S51_016900 [Perilla frutescens var. frutescens]
MSCSLKLCSPTLFRSNKTRFSHHSLQIRAQIPRDHEGRSKNIVDSNLHLLKVRIDEVRNKERLERCCGVSEQYLQGWNYADHHDVDVDVFKSRIRAQQFFVEFLDLAAVVASTFGFTILGCTSCLCIISLLIHFNQHYL